MGKSEKSGFSETIAASDLKNGKHRQLFEFMKNFSIEGQGHFLTLAQGPFTYEN